MSHQPPPTTAPDISLQVTSPHTRSERRINPSWTVSLLRAKLEFITGIPPSCQSLLLFTTPDSAPLNLPSSSSSSSSYETTPLSSLLPLHQLTSSSELRVSDTRPASMQLNLLNTEDESAQFVLDEADYAARTDSVLAWKKRAGLGRFDPGAEERRRQALRRHEEEAREKGVVVGKRVMVGGGGGEEEEDGGRRGWVRFVGVVDEIGGGGWWVGVELDEPVGRNDGRAPGGRRYFDIEAEGDKGKRGVFVRPERCRVGEWEVVNDFGGMDDEEMDGLEEI
ncbi:MAG: hypothetical protein M1816_006561 [Peltula sp. TS41687]|nr:MAG: hypothetical protein M1816_006561 [Peltula sp. TS41687]